jgi:hypothetical protein
MPHTPGSKSPLSVGARALSKHVGRATQGFWGPELKGSEQSKNERGVVAFERIINHAVWVNCHEIAVYHLHNLYHLVMIFMCVCTCVRAL